MEPAVLNKLSQSINEGDADKGKSRAAGIVGFTPELPQPPPFVPPSIDVACHDSAGLWPMRISTSIIPRPLGYMEQATVGMTLTADTGAQLGELLLELIEWMVQPAIDLTADEIRTTFQPPRHTTAIPTTGNQIPSCPLVLVAENTSYAMCVHPVAFLMRIGYI